MTTVALLGSSGFVGSSVRRALERRGAVVIPVKTPRLATAARDLITLQRDLDAGGADPQVEALADLLQGYDVVINAAGVAAATGSGDVLFGANALLPAIIARAVPRGARFLHVSSAAVQGRRALLDESLEVEPFSPYSGSKALGEQLVLRERRDTVIHRPTSVQGADRPVTQRLLRILASRVAWVAAPGQDPTPQVLVENVADAIAFLALCREQPPTVVLHPWEGLTTAELVRVAGGREPRHLPRFLARTLVSLGYLFGGWSGAIAGVVRRAEMLWFGQRQASSWLDGRWAPVHGPERWRELS